MRDASFSRVWNSTGCDCSFRRALLLFKSTFSFFLYIYKKSRFLPAFLSQEGFNPQLIPMSCLGVKPPCFKSFEICLSKKIPWTLGAWFSIRVSPRPRELRSEGRSDNCCQRGLAQGPGAAAQSSWRCRGAELDLAAPRSAALELRPAPSCGAERSRGRAKVQRRQRGLCGRDFFPG